MPRLFEIVDRDAIINVLRKNPQKALDALDAMCMMEEELTLQLIGAPLGTQEADAKAALIQGKIFGLTSAAEMFSEKLTQEEDDE